MRHALIIAVLAYRLIPPRIRSWWSLGGSSSHLALAALRAGGGLTAILPYLKPRCEEAPQYTWGSTPFPKPNPKR